jgi:hypothetical protein
MISLTEAKKLLRELENKVDELARKITQLGEK